MHSALHEVRDNKYKVNDLIVTVYSLYVQVGNNNIILKCSAVLVNIVVFTSLILNLQDFTNQVSQYGLNVSVSQLPEIIINNRCLTCQVSLARMSKVQ